MSRIEIKEALSLNPSHNLINLKGWVRTKRASKNVAFITLNDGSTINNIQIVVENNISEEILKSINSGASVSVIGELVQSKGAGQAVEVIAQSIEVLGAADPDQYPLQPKALIRIFKRKGSFKISYKYFWCSVSCSSCNDFAIHKFFNDRGFSNIHTPITGSDCEGAGEMFNVSILNKDNIPFLEDGSIDYSQDFFEKETI